MVDNIYTFQNLLPELLNGHVLTELGAYDLYQLKRTCWKYYACVPMPWTLYTYREKYLQSAPLDLAHEMLSKSWFCGGPDFLNRQASYVWENTKNFVRNSYHKNIESILFPYSERYVGKNCYHAEVIPEDNFCSILLVLLEFEMPLRFLEEWINTFTDSWERLETYLNAESYKRGEIYRTCLGRSDYLQIFTETTSECVLPQRFHKFLHDHLSANLSHLGSWITQEPERSMHYMDLISKRPYFARLVKTEFIEKGNFNTMLNIRTNDYGYWGLVICVFLCDHFNVAIPTSLIKYATSATSNRAWLEPLMRILGRDWVLTHIDIAASIGFMRYHLRDSNTTDPCPNFVRFIVENNLIDLRKSHHAHLITVGSHNLETVAADVEVCKRYLDPYRERIPGYENYRNLVHFVHEQLLYEKNVK